MSIRLFVEGRTEERFIKQLEPIIGRPVIPVNVQGKGNFAQALADRLGPALDEPGGARFVLLRDQDQGEAWANIQRSFQDMIQRALAERNYSVSVHLEPHPAYRNLLTFQSQHPPARLALHIARPVLDATGWQFVKSTIDDYVLSLALLPPVTTRFIQQGNLDMDTEQFQRKVLQETPTLFSQNGIPLNEAKDLVGIYMAVARFLSTRRSEQVETFAGVVAGRALKYARTEIEQVLASLLEAVRFVAREEEER